MLVSIVLFLSLISLAFTIMKYRMAIYESDKFLNLVNFFISSIITAALFSLFYYLTH